MDNIVEIADKFENAYRAVEQKLVEIEADSS